MLFILLTLVPAALADYAIFPGITIGPVEPRRPGIIVGEVAKPADAPGEQSVALGYHAAATGYRHIALGGEARPPSTMDTHWR